MNSLEEKPVERPEEWDTRVGKRLPNILTCLRLFAVPVFVFLLVDPTPQSSLAATAIFVIASLTDWLDGYIARLYRAESVWGKLMDPLADKVLVMAALIMLAAAPAEPRVPAWMVVLLLAREMIVTGLRSLAAVQGTVVAASNWAKHKTAWTMISVFFLLVDEPYRYGDIVVDYHRAGIVFLWIALVLAMTSGLGYASALRKMFIPLTI